MECKLRHGGSLRCSECRLQEGEERSLASVLCPHPAFTFAGIVSHRGDTGSFWDLDIKVFGLARHGRILAILRWPVLLTIYGRLACIYPFGPSSREPLAMVTWGSIRGDCLDCHPMLFLVLATFDSYNRIHGSLEPASDLRSDLALGRDGTVGGQLNAERWRTDGSRPTEGPQSISDQEAR